MDVVVWGLGKKFKGRLFRIFFFLNVSIFIFLTLSLLTLSSCFLSEAGLPIEKNVLLL